VNDGMWGHETSIERGVRKEEGGRRKEEGGGSIPRQFSFLPPPPSFLHRRGKMTTLAPFRTRPATPR